MIESFEPQNDWYGAQSQERDELRVSRTVVDLASRQATARSRPLSNRNRQEPVVTVVIIGRNEGQRLIDCIESVKQLEPVGYSLEIIYADSGSSDGSVRSAEALGVKVIQVPAQKPTAALGRNAGWLEASGDFVMFLDGDTLLHPEFIARALAEFDNRNVAVVWGHRRERHPEQSVFTEVLDLDWIYPPGDSDFCGGDALMRVSALVETGGFNHKLVAGEEPDLCRRMRALGWRIVHIDAPMTSHDLAITTLGEYWRRALRTGHAYAEISSLYKNTHDPLWTRESHRNCVHAIGLLCAPLLLFAAFWLAEPAGIALLTVCLVMFSRTLERCRWKSANKVTRLRYAIHSHFQQVPVFFGQMLWLRNHWSGQHGKLIEYH